VIRINTKEKDQEVIRRYEELNQYPRIFDWVDRWAQEFPDEIAIIEYYSDEKITWKEFASMTKLQAAKLLTLGIKKGDIVATSLTFLKEHAYLMYACARIGAIIAILDIRLKMTEIDRHFYNINPKAYFSHGKTHFADFRPNLKMMIDKYGKKNGGTCELFVQIQKESDLVVDGAMSFSSFMKDVKFDFKDLEKAQKLVGKRDPILILFTTGSTGYPKPALICSENILMQNIGEKVAWDVNENDTMLVNLPPSHVGGSTIQFMGQVYSRGKACLLPIYNPVQSLDAIQKYKITFVGMIPALYSLIWRVPNYKSYDLSSLRFAIVTGQTVTKEFLKKLSDFCSNFGSTFGLTELGGVCTYCPYHMSIDEVHNTAGFDSPICPISIRGQMKEDGSAGDEKSPGEIGHMAFSGPQPFLGYLHDEENTRKTISKDGFCYTGDLGSYDELGLHFTARFKNIIKPKGYQVYPKEIEDFIHSKLRNKISVVGVVGAHHDVFNEGVIAFVEKSPNVELKTDEIEKFLPEIASYKRPLHIEIIEPNQMPLNRTNKIDYLALRKRGSELTEKLRSKGEWDSD